MRSEQEMMALILDVARRDVRIRAVLLNGSRANPSAPKDIWRDYDIVYVVDTLDESWFDPGWIDVFGPRAMLQNPYILDSLRNENVKPYCAFLMLLADGNRIDLSVIATEETIASFEEDSLTVVLLDKDGLLPPVAPPTDRSYWTPPPSRVDFDICTNEFLWCMQNVAKGLARGELPYARNMLEQVVRPELDDMVRWWIGLRHAYRVNTGKMGKWFEKYLTPAFWQAYQETCAGLDRQGLWAAVFAAGDLLRTLGREVAAAHGHVYPEDDDTRMTAYLRRLHAAPEDGDR